MMRVLLWIVALAPVSLFMADAVAADAADAASGASSAQTETARTAAAAAAAVTAAERAERPPDFLEMLVDSILSAFNINESGNTIAHFSIAALLLVIALLARRIVTGIVFALLRKVSSRTQTTFDDKLFPALETPAAFLIMVVGVVSALRVLRLKPEADYYIASGSRVAFSLAVFWLLWRLLSSALDHLNEVSKTKGLGVSAFMPWIKKTLLTVFGVLAVLLTVQSLGYDVKAILAGLGIGGLAFALAAQDTLANIFGAVVVAVDQPFKIGEVVRIGTNVGIVEDIGLRSTRIRMIDRSLMVVPNKTVAAETITNLSRFTQRRCEQVIGLTYDTKPDDMNAIVEEFKQIILAEPEIDQNSVMVFFRDYSASSLDIWVVYMAQGPDFQAFMRMRQRINLAFMRAVDARGLSFAFPTQTLHFAGEIADRLADRERPLPLSAPPSASP